MKRVCLLAHVLALIACFSSEAQSTPVTDESSAIRAAMTYTKDRCTVETPCTFRPKREGRQWSVRVQFTRINAPGEKARPYPSGYVVLYVDADGRLTKRIEGE